MKYDRRKFCDAPNEVKLDIVKTELKLVTHNGTTKEDLLMLLDWCYYRLIKGDLKEGTEPEETSSTLQIIQNLKREHTGPIEEYREGYFKALEDVENSLKAEQKESLHDIIYNFIVQYDTSITLAIATQDHELLNKSIKDYLDEPFQSEPEITCNGCSYEKYAGEDYPCKKCKRNWYDRYQKAGE